MEDERGHVEEENDSEQMCGSELGEGNDNSSNQRHGSSSEQESIEKHNSGDESMDAWMRIALDYFSLFVDESMLCHIVEQTKLNFEQYVASRTLGPRSWMRQWSKEEHSIAELCKFIALILTMGIDSTVPQH